MNKILLINGSPNEFGCTYTALNEIANTLELNKIATQILYLGKKPITGCIACNKCGNTGRCVFNDKVNEVLDNLDGYAGIIIGSVVSCRRGGASSAFDRLNKYFGICNMHIVGSQYWNQVHGFTPEDVRKDKEGLQTMRTLAQNMTWLLNNIEAGSKQGIAYPPLQGRLQLIQEGMTSKEVQQMSDNDLLDMDYFFNEDIFDDSDDFEEGFYIF